MFNNNLIKDCKKGKRKAQFKLYHQYCDAMLCISMRYLKQQDVAEDAVQEAFIKAFKNIDQFDENYSFGGWIKRFVINQSIDAYRKLKYHDQLEDHNLEIAENEQDSWNVDENISSQQIQECIDSLPEKYATILKLFLIEGYDHDEIAEILGIKSNNSRIQLHRGKKLLKEKLKALKYERFA